MEYIMITDLRKLVSLVVLTSLTAVLFSATMDRALGIETVGKFDINGATLEGKYLLGLVSSQPKLSAQGESKPAWTMVNYALQVWRANFKAGDIAVTAELNGNTGSDFAKDNGNNPLSISIGDPLSSSFATTCFEGEGCLSGSPGQQKVGTLDQEPQVSATLNWNNTLDNLGVRAMSWALFPVTTGFIKSGTPQGPLDLTTEVLILPEEASLYVDNGPFGFDRADPDLVLLSDQPGLNAITVGTNGLSPFAEWKSIALDDLVLPKVPYIEPNTTGSFPSGQVFVPPTGTWTMKDPMTLDELINSSLAPGIGFLNANINGFLKTNLENSGAVISFPVNFETGEHVVTLVAGPSSNFNDKGNFIPVYGISGKEARTLSAKFLLMDPKFTLDKNQAYPGDTLNVTGSGFAPYSRVKIYAETVGGGNVTIGEASTDSTGGFRTQVVRLPPKNSDFLSWINGTANGDLRVKIDDPPFVARYSSVYIQEIVEGVTQSITYLQPTNK
jgi:hypothetical protein